MKHALFVYLLSGILACPGFSQSSVDGKNYGESKNKNLRSCFAGLGACDLSALRSDQAKQIADMGTIKTCGSVCTDTANAIITRSRSRRLGGSVRAASAEPSGL